ncbi:MAG: alpha-L-fucosidase [Bacillota bacterium]|nr:alpha-L-fucosidase [Bacillota bacterium]
MVSLLLLLVSICAPVTTKAATTYQATWASVDTHTASPEWFQDAKFGIYFHWGVFSVPAFGDEWYPRWMYNKDRNEYKNQLSKYGDPFSNWPYQNFINGANNKSGQWTQFAPKLVSAGGKFDPDAWAQLFADAGAKFAGNVAEHHDGFSMWDSKVNEWNSVAKGPKLDLSGLFAKAIRAKNLKYLMSMHHAFNFTGFYEYVPAQSDVSLKKLYGQLGQSAEEQLWYDKLKEIIDNYQPDIIWEDFNLGKISEAQRLKFLSYYYNKANEWGKDVVATYKDGFDNKGEVLDYERGGPGGLSYPYWLTDDSISSSSWCYTQGIGYYSTKSMIHSLIDRVSKNGNLLLNIMPMADGTIPQAQKDILLGMGSWLKKYGEAIYSTRAWNTYGEGPTKMGGGSFTAPKEGTAQDIRFTRNKANNALYAIGLGWPSNNQMVITTLKSGAFDASKITGITFLNGGGSCTWSQDSTGLKINLPANLADNMGYAVKISLSGAELASATFYQDYDFAGTSVALKPGNYTTAQLSAAGIPNNSVSSIKAPSGLSVEVYDGDNFSGTKWTFTSDNSNFGSAGCNDVMSSVKIINNASSPTPTNTPTMKPTSTPTATPTSAISIDINHDGAINMADIVLIANVFNSVRGDGKYILAYDLNSDGVINMADVIIIASKFNTVVNSK